MTHVATAALLVLVCAAPAVAQSAPPQRPYRGLFGGNEADPNSRQSLNVTFSINGGYDDNATADQGGGGGGLARNQASTFLGGSAGLNYARRWDRATLTAGASASTRYYQDIPELKTSTSYGAAAGLAVNLSPRTSLSVGQSVSYSPYFQFGFLPTAFAPQPGQIIAPDPDLVVEKREAVGYHSSASIGHQLSRRGSLSARYGYTTTDYTESEFGAWSSHNAGGGYSYSLTQNASLRLGYGYRRADYRTSGGSNRTRETHDINAGVDYSKSLSFSRRTQLSFSTGSTIATGVDENQEQRTFFRLIGRATLSHHIGQTWTAALAYVRGVGYADGFEEPYFSDSVSANIGGYWGRRTTLSMSAGWSNGKVGFSGRDNDYSTSSVAANAGFALSQYINLTAQAFYYRYNFGQGLELPVGIAPELDRFGIRGGLSFWLPLLR